MWEHRRSIELKRGGKVWRRRRESNPRITVLQTAPLATWVRRPNFAFSERTIEYYHERLLDFKSYLQEYTLQIAPQQGSTKLVRKYFMDSLDPHLGCKRER